MPNSEEVQTQKGPRGRIPSCFLSNPNQDSDSKSTSLECAIACSNRPSSPTPMPKPAQDVHLNRKVVSNMPLHLCSNHTATRRASLPQKQDTNAKECRRITLESEACMEVLAKQGIAFLDWGPPVTKKYSPRRETSARDSSSRSSSGSNKARQGSNDGHITVQIARRPLPGQQEGVTYVRYYRTGDGQPATTTSSA